MPSRVEKLQKSLASTRRRAKESAERSTNLALTGASCYAAGYITGRYKDTVTVGENETTKEGGVNSLMVIGGLGAAGAAVGMAPQWVGAVGIGLLGGVLAIDGLAKGVKDKLANP